MEYELIEKQVTWKSALIYIPVSLGAALIFLIAATKTGNYPLVARIGGTIWVATLSLIISMPIAISGVKKLYQKK